MTPSRSCDGARTASPEAFIELAAALALAEAVRGIDPLLQTLARRRAAASDDRVLPRRRIGRYRLDM